ncbi:MAG: signal peptide peptidase SppA [Chitinophagales bacterium]|jgi:protease-4|nr:signal peptide peptidase SppA [Chitinophagales bacterium]
MRKFIQHVLSVIIGNAIFLGLLSIVFFALLVGLIASSSKSNAPKVEANSILKITLYPNMIETRSSYEDKGMNFMQNEIQMSVFDILEVINDAKNNNDIKGILVEMTPVESGSYANIDLIRQALIDFKASNKPVLAYGELASQKSYYLASAADKIFINPAGGIGLSGFGASLAFFKGTLDKVGIEPQIIYAGKFKSATEPLRLTKMSEENKIQIKEYLADIASVVYKNILDARKIDSATLIEGINSMKALKVEEAKKLKLVDDIMYWDEVESILEKQINISKDKIKYVSALNYINDIGLSDKSQDIAVYCAEGDIVDYKSSDIAIYSKKVVKDLRKIAGNDKIKAVILRVNSPGGSVLASDVIYRELKLLKAKKPVVVSMGSYAASGGYYISALADRIFAEPNTLTGSIGVFSIIPNMKRLFEEKIGMTFDEVELNDHAVLGLNKSLDASEKAMFEVQVVEIYDKFKKIVSEGRKLPLEQVEAVAQGRVWTGNRAKSLGLVDEIGSLPQAADYLAKTYKLEPKYFFVNTQPSFFETLLSDLNSNDAMLFVKQRLIQSLLPEYAQIIEKIEKIKGYQGVQARLLNEVEIK